MGPWNSFPTLRSANQMVKPSAANFFAIAAPMKSPGADHRGGCVTLAQERPSGKP
jgi:hypothetical protein